MFEALSEKLSGVFRRLGDKGRLTEKDIDDALREVRLALLEADVNFKVAREFVGRIRERALEEDLLRSLSPGRQVVKITNQSRPGILHGDSVHHAGKAGISNNAANEPGRQSLQRSGVRAGVGADRAVSRSSHCGCKRPRCQR